MYSLKSATAYSSHSVDTSISTQALEQWQLAETRFKNRQNGGYNRGRETNGTTEEYCIEGDRYGAVTQKIRRIPEDLYREHLHRVPQSRRKPAGREEFRLKLRGCYKVVAGREKDVT